MNLKSVYLLLCVLGIVVPYWQFIPWVAEHGLDMGLFARQLFENRIGAFFGMDVIVSALTLIVFVRAEGPRISMLARWLPIVGLVTVGVSLGLPLFLYLRESAVTRTE